MTKLESAREIIKQNGDCKGISCSECFLKLKPCGYGIDTLKLAKEYVKENEVKFEVGCSVICTLPKNDIFYFKGVRKVRNINDNNYVWVGGTAYKDGEGLKLVCKFKVGDWVLPKSSYVSRDGSVFTFKSGAYEIEKINGNQVYLKDIDYPYFEVDDLTLVCGFVKGELIYVDNYKEDFESSRKEKFDSYRPELIYPFVVTVNDACLESFKYAKAIPKKKYKPYSKFNNDWIGKRVIAKENDDWSAKIIGFDYETNFLAVKANGGGIWEITLQDAFDTSVWYDRKMPFGEEICID